MEELIFVVLQFLFELLIEAISYTGLEWPFRGEQQTKHVFSKRLLFFLAGCVVAALSLLVFSQTLIQLPLLRLAHLILAPLISGLIAKQIAIWRLAKNCSMIPRHQFWQAYCFTCGLVLIRFLYAIRQS